MDNKNIVGIVSVLVVILAQAAGLYGFISSQINDNSQKLVEIEKKIIKIEILIESVEKSRDDTRLNGDRITDLEIASNQNFRKSIELNRKFEDLENKVNEFKKVR